MSSKEDLLKLGLAERALAVTPFMVMEVLEAAARLEAAGRDVIHMEVGEPDFRTPEIVVQAMKDALDGGAFKYAHSQGDPLLRETLSWHYRERYGVDVSPDRFLVCPGTSPGLLLLFGALLKEGDGVLMSNPYYSCYPNLVGFFGGRPVLCPVKESDGFRFNPDDVKRALDPSIKAILVNSPANPTGAVLDAERLEALAALDRFVISDEIYHGLSYLPDRDHTILEYTDQAAVVGGFSKNLAMTGWRVGYLIVPPELIRPLRSMFQNFLISVNAAAQKAAAVALRQAWPEVAKMRAIYDRRRRLLIDGLREMGFVVMVEPAGAFYVLARADHLSSDSKSLVFEILEEAGVGLTPGIEFGSGAEGFLRFSYATSEENIRQGLMRLASFSRRRQRS
ncbi:MAG: aminotransferase class I/II-fold pyridoxal phosphate-dependent enzyme [Deltaproteobacteria bacterium]|jgi:aspartate/methionine/tyrosine aminotransferase|nr:aminotransferase class I/II-fold pyridoxal phosphate-dependent enzyme [Deltaproteobacteria bacterium]